MIMIAFSNGLYNLRLHKGNSTQGPKETSHAVHFTHLMDSSRKDFIQSIEAHRKRGIYDLAHLAPGT